MGKVHRYLKMGTNILAIMLTTSLMESVTYAIIIGSYYWKNGSMYEGEFVDGSRSGHGKWLSNIISEDCDEYVGEYQDDKKNGTGVYKWADGSEYEGKFKNDLKEGVGTIRYKNGKIARLLWKNGQPIRKITN